MLQSCGCDMPVHCRHCKPDVMVKTIPWNQMFILSDRYRCKLNEEIMHFTDFHKVYTLLRVKLILTFKFVKNPLLISSNTYHPLTNQTEYRRKISKFVYD